MPEECEYIEPTQEHAFQMVEVSTQHRHWVSRKLLAVLPETQESRFICEDIDNQKAFCDWRFARIARPLTYAERQAKCGLKVGDRVRFTRAWGDAELGARMTCYTAIAKEVGNTGRISDECGSGFRVTFNRNNSWWLPYFVLEKVEDRVATRRDFNKTVYVDGNPQDEFEIEFIYEVPKEPWRAVVVKNDKRFVYELYNLRVKE